ncbi:MAG: hypothetical protein ACRESE_02310, partial [Gammaproteobacteria bacterium]
HNVVTRRLEMAASGILPSAALVHPCTSLTYWRVHSTFSPPRHGACGVPFCLRSQRFEMDS